MFPVRPGSVAYSARMELSILDAVLLVGLSARLTRLVVVDDAGEPLRLGVLRVCGALARERARGIDFAARLMGCPFCVGFWLSLGVVVSWLLAGDTLAWQAIALVFTLNYVHAHLNAALDSGD